MGVNVHGRSAFTAPVIFKYRKFPTGILTGDFEIVGTCTPRMVFSLYLLCAALMTKPWLSFQQKHGHPAEIPGP